MSNDIGSQEMSFASDQQELQLADAVSTPGLQEFSAFSEVSLSKEQPHDLTLATHPSFCSQSVGETMATPPIHQPAVGQTHSNYLPVHSGLTTEFQLDENAPSPTIETNKGLHNTTESVRKIEPLQDTTEAPQMDNPISDKTSARNQTSVYETSLNSDSSVNETNNHIPENEISTSNLELPIIDEPPPSNNPPMDTTPLSSHPSLDEPPPSHHPPEDGTSPSHHSPHDGTSPSNQAPVDGASSSNLPPVDETSSSKHPPAGGTSPNSQPPIVDGTSPNNHPLVDKTPPSQHPPMSYIVAPLSSHSLADECQSSQRALVDGTSPSSHPGPPIINGTTPSNHASADKTTPSKCLSVDKPPSDKHPLADFSDNQQLVDNSLPNKKVPVEVPSRINHTAECEPQIKSKLATNRALLLDETPSDHLPICKTSDFFSSQVPTDKLSNQPPIDDKSCDKHTQHEVPSRYREEVLQLLEKLRLRLQSRPFPPGSSSIQTQGGKQQLFRSSNLSLKENTDIGVPIDGEKEGRFNLHHACMIGDDDMTRRILKSGTNPNIQDIYGYTALHYACRGGHFTCVNRLLCHSDDPVAFLQVPCNDGATPLSIRSETSGETLLHLACNSKDEFVFQKLLEAGADPNAKDNSGLTPLMILVLSGVVSSSTSELVAALHSHGCNLNAALEVNETNWELQPWNGWTALHMAVGKQLENVDSDCIKSLISCGASIQATDAQGHTSLHIACIVGYFDNLDLLAPNEDYFQIKDGSGCMPLYYVCRYGHCECFRKVLFYSPKILLQAVNTDGATPLTVVDEEGRTILHHVCREGYDDVTVDLLEADADPSIKDSQGYTPLHYACENGHDKCIQAILYSSMDCSDLPEIKDANGRIPLHIACMQQHHHLIKALKPSYEHFLIEDKDGYSPLYYICTKGDCLCLAEICDLLDETLALSSLLTAKATADGATHLTIVDEEGLTILHHVCREGYDETIDLLEAGADPSIKDSQGYTPLHYACENGHDKCIQAIFCCTKDPSGLLEIKDSNGRIPLHIACMRRHHHILRILKPSFEHFLISDDDGCTPLHYVCKNDYCQCMAEICDLLSDETPGISSLLTAGMNAGGTTPLTFVDEGNQTMLHHACRDGYDTVTSNLLKAGADPTVPDSQSYTPLHYACKNGHDKCVNAMFHSSVKPSDLIVIQDATGCTPLHTASKTRHYCLFTILKFTLKDLLIRNNDGYTPLCYICQNGDWQYIERLSITFRLSSLLTARISTAGTTLLTVVDEKGQTMLLHVCREGIEEWTQRLLKAGADPSVQDSEGNTPLHYACERGDICCVRNLLQYCKNPTALLQIKNKEGVTPLSMWMWDQTVILHSLCEENYLPDMTRKFLQAGANPNVEDGNGFTPLMKVITSNLTDSTANAIVTILCEFNCDVNLKRHKFPPTKKNVQIWEGTALHMAAKLGSKPLCVQTLTAKCTTAVDIRDDHGRIPLHITAIYGHHNLMKYLGLAHHDRECLCIKDSDGCTPLYYACKGGNYPCIRKMFKYIPNDSIQRYVEIASNDGTTPLTVADANGRTALHHALHKGDVKLACKLLRVGADLAVKDHLGCTPLTIRSESDSTRNRTFLHHLCTGEGTYDLIVELLKAGADPNVKDNNGYTPFMLALKYINDASASTILTALYDFEHDLSITTTSLLRTALHIATENNKAKCVELLIAQGADLLAKTLYGKTSSHSACIKGHANLLSHFLTEMCIASADATSSIPLHYACEYGRIECVKRIMLMENDSLNLQFQVTKLNLDSATPLTVTNNQGRTILHHACAAFELPLVKELLKYGACPNAQDNEGFTPLMLTLQAEKFSEILLELSEAMVSSALWDPHIKDRRGRTALHHAARYEDVRIACAILVAGCDISAEDNNGQSFSSLMSKTSLQLLNKQLLRVDRRQIVCVIGHPKSGKSTLVAAFQQAPLGTLRKVSTFLQSDKIILTDTSRTAGINTATFSADKLGNIIFFDFAGQSEYYASHLAFLESALTSKGATITFIMVVDLRIPEEERFSQCMEWLFPIKSIVNDHNVLNVVLIGSHQDQLKSMSSTSSVQSLNNTLQKLKATLDISQIHFIDSWGMDCRRLSSKGMTHLQDYMKSVYSSLCESDNSRQVPIGPSLLFHKLKKIENPPLAITPSMIIDTFKGGHSPFPLTVLHIDKYCQDLAASGLVIYIPNREDAGRSWLILEMEEVLSCVHGKLFAPDSRKFPMRYKNLANQFGLVQADELKLAFSGGLLDPDMVQKLLMSMEFCHPVDSTLMADETITLALETSRAVFQDQRGFRSDSTVAKVEWLFFPSLVQADTGALTMSTECDVPSEGCHWVSWELTTVKAHFFTPRLQQAVFIRLTCSYVQKQISSHSSVKKHSCTVSKNAMSWSTIHGIDICVQIIHKSIIKVLARTRPGVKVSSLMDLVSNVVADILKTHANHSPGVDVFSVFREIKQGIPGEHSVTVSSIIESVQASGSYVNSKEHPPKLISLKDLFCDWEVSTELLEKMHINTCNTDLSISTTSENEQCHDTSIIQKRDAVNLVQQSICQTPGPSLEVLYSFLSSAKSDVVTAKWKQFASYLGVLDNLMKTAEQIICDSCSGKYRLLQDRECLYYVLEAWLAKEEGTGDLPRTWETVLSALEDSGIPIQFVPANLKVEESLENQHPNGNQSSQQSLDDLEDTVSLTNSEEEFTTMAGNSQKRGVNGDSPHAGKTVFSALGDVGHTPLAEEEEQKPLQSGALAVLEEKSHSTSEAIRSGSEYTQVVKNYSSPSNSAQTEAKQGDFSSLLENIEREEITTRPCPVVTIQEQLPYEHEPPATSMEDEEDVSDTQQKQIFLQAKPTEEELARLVGSQMCAEWNIFSVYLGVQKHIRNTLSYNCPRRAEDCFREVVNRWLAHEVGTGDNRRTWETVFSALKGAGYPLLVEEVKQKLSKRQKSA